MTRHDPTCICRDCVNAAWYRVAVFYELNTRRWAQQRHDRVFDMLRAIRDHFAAKQQQEG